MMASPFLTPKGNDSLPPLLQEKLKKSLVGSENITMRRIDCPYCGFLVDIVGSDVRLGHKMIHCRKCKRDYLISYEHFRTQKSRLHYSSSHRHKMRKIR